MSVTLATPHPAKFNDDILQAIGDTLIYHGAIGGTVLDPFAGTGRIHALAEIFDTIGVELEPEWANMHPRTIVGNALCLPFPDASFDAIATSPCYGNRMADHHNAREECRNCAGRGEIEEGGGAVRWDCHRCGGTGKNTYRRHTYRHYLGRALHPDNSGQLQWGPKYQAFHTAAWKEADRVLKPGGLFVLNIKDHLRGDKVQQVTYWHMQEFFGMGYGAPGLGSTRPIYARGNRHGANAHRRIDWEWVLTFRKAA